MTHATLLVVEDDDGIRSLLVEYFKVHAEAEVDGARDGAEALHQIATRKYDVVLLDLMMPHMSGVDFLLSLEALTSDPSVKSLDVAPTVFILTGASPDAIPSGEIEHRFPSLVRGVLRKPIDVSALSKCLEPWL